MLMRVGGIAGEKIEAVAVSVTPHRTAAGGSFAEHRERLATLPGQRLALLPGRLLAVPDDLFIDRDSQIVLSNGLENGFELLGAHTQCSPTVFVIFLSTMAAASPMTAQPGRTYSSLTAALDSQHTVALQCNPAPQGFRERLPEGWPGLNGLRIRHRCHAESSTRLFFVHGCPGSS
jgi:hypothetical protein